MEDKKILRVIDANINRCREGLRVVEDIFRFVNEDDSLSKELKAVRHKIKAIVSDRKFKIQLISSREADSDVGKNIDSMEMTRASLDDVLYANFQRVKESIRVLEESFKLVNPDKVGAIKDIRYKVYTIEKKIWQT